MDLLRAGAVREAAERMAVSTRALQYVTRRLWDEDEQVARSSARALGEAARRAPERGREVARRFLWALNDESATNAGPVLAALAEMAERAPDVVRPFVGALVPLLEDDELSTAISEVIERLVAASAGAADEIRDQVRAVLPRIPRDRASRVAAAVGLEVV